MDSMCTVFSVGAPFPGPVPQTDGAVFELLPGGGMIFLIQLHKQRPAEKSALRTGFNRYSFFESADPTSLAFWVFNFPAAVGFMEAPFHAGLYSDNRVDDFLLSDTNMLFTVMLDGPIITDLRVSGLQTGAMSLFRNTVRKQAAEGISLRDYHAALYRLHRMSPAQIFNAGHIFRHKS